MRTHWRRRSGAKRLPGEVLRGMEPLEPRTLLAGDVIIAEFLALNDGGGSGLVDEDGDSSDWIELQNVSSAPVDLSGWSLTDDVNDLAKWEFPAKTIAAHERLVVFASGKDRLGAELHTNFELDGAGEYLALIEPDGATIASEFAPSYPDQIDNVSYGILDVERTTRPLVTESSLVRAIVPRDNSMGAAWTAPEYDDSAWPIDDFGTEGTQGIGFDAGAPLPPPFIASIARSGSSNATPVVALAGLNEDVVAYSDRTHQFNGVNAVNSIAAMGLAGADLVRMANDDRNVGSFSLSLTANGIIDLYLFIDDRVGDGANFNPPTLGTVMPWVAALGFVDTGLNIGIDEDGNGSGPGGDINQFASIFKLTGVSGTIVLGAQNDGTSRNMYGVAALRSGPTGTSLFAEEIATNVEPLMYQAGTSAYIRSTFAFGGGGTLEELTLRVKYDDGFVAYLNGTEIVRRNAPGTPGVAVPFDGGATTSRPNSVAVVYEDFDVTSFANLLLSDSPNVLAIHGLNDSLADTDFLVSAELTAVTSESAGTLNYFAFPTPGQPNISGVFGFVEDTQFDGIPAEPGLFHDAGYYNVPFHIVVSTATPDAEIRYTTNGTPPTATTGTVYTTPILISGTTTLRVAAFKPGFASTDVDTQSYIFPAQVLQQTGTGLPAHANWGHVGPDWAVDPDIVNAANPADRFAAEHLLAVPTVSLSLPFADMFGADGQGIYIAGAGSERAASIEIIQNDGSDGVRINGSVEIQGGTSDDRWKDDKLSMQLKFKAPYGPTKLNYDLFGNGASESFDTLILDGVLNFSWVHTTDANQRGNAKYIQDQFVADLQNAMGGFAPHGRYMHLFLNGLYWGMYYVHERPDETFNSDYQGGDKDEWNVIKHTPTTVVQNALTNQPGVTATSDYNEMLALAGADLTIDANYQAIAAKLDIDNFIDYLLVNWYTGNDDWPAKNWYASRQASAEGKWRFHSWDAEHVLKSVSVNRVGESPNGLHSLLARSAGYRQRFGDRVQQHFFGDGVLTTQNAAAIYQARMTEIDAAIRGESARWGDNSATTPYTRSNWLATQNGLLASYFPQRTATVVSQLRAAGLFPNVGAPSTSVTPGEVVTGTAVALADPNAPTGAIYYTLDGSEPSVPATATSTLLLAENAQTRAFVPTAANGGSGLGLSWTQRMFNDATWSAGNAGVGYDRDTSGTDFLPLIGTGLNVESQMYNLTTSVYMRSSFNIADASAFDSLTLQIKYDDGFVAYLNGVEVARSNAPSPAAWNSTATAQNGDTNAIVFRSFDMSAFRNQLVSGTNVLAIHGLNASVNSSDLLMRPQLIGAKTTGSGIGLSAIAYSGPIRIDETTTIKARVRRGTEWSALAEAFYSVDVPIRVSELYYNPPGGSELTEYIELENISTSEVDLSGVQFTEGIDYEFLETDVVRSIPPGGRIVIAHDPFTFAAAFPNVPTSAIADRAFGGSLDNGGEPIELRDRGGAVVLAFRYDDAWHPMSDGDGYSLVRIDTRGAKGDWGVDSAWRTSYAVGGTPGSGDVVMGDLDGDLIVGLADLAIMQRHFGMTSGATYVMGDCNGDGAVNRSDLAAFAANFGFSAAGSAGSAAADAMVARQMSSAADVRDAASLRAIRRTARGMDASGFPNARAADDVLARGVSLADDGRLIARRIRRD